MGSSFGDVPEYYPVLGPYLRQLRWLGLYNEVELAHENWKKPRVSTTSFTREQALEVVCMRYQTTVFEIEDCENLIRRVDVLPALISHPLLHVMLTTDYG
jgi:hypothetical protein